MTPRQIELIQESFQHHVRPIAAAAGKLFYGRLLELDPSLRPMFRDIDGQGRKLMQVMGAAVGMLRRPDDFFATVTELGHRHVAYGVRQEHFHTVGAALLWTLERGLGEAFTPEVRDAWVALYDAITWIMCRAAGKAAA